MITEFLERLTKRKTEVERTAATSWQTLVCRVADEQQADPDAVLAELDRLNKTPDDLKVAVELLNKRREWVKLVVAGTLAEAEHPKIVKTIEAEVATFAAAEEKHEQRLRPMHGQERSAVQAMSEGSRAKTELLRTATDPVALQSVVEADEKMRALQQEQIENSKELDAKNDRRRCSRINAAAKV